jgi:predicted nucleotidyltransferase
MIDDALIAESLRRLREAAPEASRIILFGSAQRGDTTEDSDIDYLVVVPSVESRMRESVRLRIALRGIPAAFDIVVVTDDDIADLDKLRGGMVYDALTRGRVLHAA